MTVWADAQFGQLKLIGSWNREIIAYSSLLPIFSRQFDRDVPRRTYHDGASIRMAVASERLEKQQELFGKHAHIP